MSLKQKPKKDQSLAAGIGIGTLVSVLLSIILSMAVATFVLKERIGENAIELITRIIMLISALLGCIIAMRSIEDKLLIVSGAIGIIYLLILAGAGILFFDGGFHNMGTSILSVAAGCVASCAICIRGKGSRIKRKRVNR